MAKEKLLQRALTSPRNFRFSDMLTLVVGLASGCLGGAAVITYSFTQSQRTF
jgi:hypothetical protein